MLRPDTGHRIENGRHDLGSQEDWVLYRVVYCRTTIVLTDHDQESSKENL